MRFWFFIITTRGSKLFLKNIHTIYGLMINQPPCSLLLQSFHLLILLPVYAHAYVLIRSEHHALNLFPASSLPIQISFASTLALCAYIK
jgi:hypothetical protein